jgi:FkbM family methyltransferase
MLKKFIKNIILGIISLLPRVPGGPFVLQKLLESVLEQKKSVLNNEVSMLFATPNWLCNYRVISFSTKEPITLLWLESIPGEAVLWDVGANVGLYSIYPAKRNGVRVFAFEPSVFNLELLARNIFLNDLQELITIVPNALCDSSGPNLFKMSTTVWGGALSSFGQDFDQHGDILKSIFEYKTMGITMDQAVSQLGIPVPRFIKIDVDGIEHFILRGGVETLNLVESVMIEIDDSFNEQAEESTRILRNAGLKLYRKCDGDGARQYNQWWVREGV